ncbi:MAG: HNH endonuclease [Saprospiraceae bacterium]|nr:HNH endonuclease [Saprospiraceae bacterium]MCF8251352.1 HNH endonuclease [Saprospiraceae bacterium]MCF8280527.1 HNH endonuclease [Bacteroidales bacterium]MCF8313255.1 HNH endonuclease [Saprospiraceae bacterium]MCF8441702.1 HNH endonuclease [Saprospiraceae bacterium]
MSRNIPEKLRVMVANRADHVCEYCLMHQDDLVFGCQIDHILSLKHGGETLPENLAYSCLTDNINKGSDIGTVLLPDRKLTRFFNPREDKWEDHFTISEGHILPKTQIGEATVKILQLNAPDRVLRRQLLMLVGKYPGR